MAPLPASFAVLLALASPDGVVAAPRSTPTTVETAKALMLSGRREEARSVLLDLAREQPASNDVAFLLGLLAIDATDYREAIGQFRAILVREPAALRVRLELGRAFYLSHDYENAYRQFQFARAGKLPAGVDASIDKFVAAIRRDKNWSYTLGVAIAPDTNINSGTSSRETEIFGLPFEFGDGARRHSGTGMTVTGSAEFSPRLSEGARLRVGGSVERREYEGHEFDDMTASAYAGPRLLLGHWDLSILATAFRRNFGGHRLNEGPGARVEAIHGFGARTALSLGVSAQQVRYPHYPLQDGRYYSVTLGTLHSLTPASMFNARVGASRRGAQAPELANWSGWLSVGYYRDFAGGFSVYVEPSYAFWRYDASDPFFGKRRADRLAQVQLVLLNRRIVLSRFTPRIALTLARHNSNINLYEFSQRRLEVGFTSSF